MNTCQIKQTTKTLKFVPANNSSLKVGSLFSKVSHFTKPQSVTLMILYRSGVQIGTTFFLVGMAVARLEKKKDKINTHFEVSEQQIPRINI